MNKMKIEQNIYLYGRRQDRKEGNDEAWFFKNCFIFYPMVKLLFLSHCLVKDYQERLRNEAEERGYEVYVVPGGSLVRKIIQDYLEDIEKIVGIACEEEIDLARNYLKKSSLLANKLFAVELSSNGCKDTTVNLEEVLNVL